MVTKKLIFFLLLFLLIIKEFILSQSSLINIGFGQNSNTLSNNQSSILINISEPLSEKDINASVKIFLLLTILSLAPAILVLCTSFIRIIVVLAILRQAIGLQQLPPNQILIGFALFLTFYNMTPVIQEINKNAIEPYKAKKIGWEKLMDEVSNPLKKFMLKQTSDDDLAVFLKFSNKKIQSRKELGMNIVIPAFVLSELKKGFQIGFIIYIPFLIVDIIISSILLSMGMVMLPPIMISLPFKILLFVLIDGWRLITDTLIKSFNY